MTNGRAAEISSGLFDLRQDVGHGLAVKPSVSALTSFSSLRARRLRKSLDDAFGGLDADVRHHQPRFELLQHLLVDFAAGNEVREIVA